MLQGVVAGGGGGLAGIGIGVRQVGRSRAGQAAVGHGKAEQGLPDRVELAAGILQGSGFALGAQAEHQAAGEQGDDDQHHGQFDQREAMLRGGRVLPHRVFSRRVGR